MSISLHQRLMALQSEYENGQKLLADLEAKRASLTSTMLRIEGAIQLLRELVDEEVKRSAMPQPPTSS